MAVNAVMSAQRAYEGIVGYAWLQIGLPCRHGLDKTVIRPFGRVTIRQFDH